MLELYNTMSRSREPFRPINDRKVEIFTCGPSIYRRPHVGNYRTFLWEDVLVRYLEYLGFKVKRVINFTDIEDKSIEEAAAWNESVDALTQRMAESFHSDAEILGMKLPDEIPRSSTSIGQAVELIKTLMKKGYAYEHRGDIFFEPARFKGFGKLFRLDMSRWPKETRRYRKDTYPGQRWNLGDFILWHGYRKGDQVFWDTEIGKGRPSWNIQDPAIITQHLGFSIDISCGGIDNLYRHHDYNLAVIEAASGREFSRYWLHGEHLLVSGKKMSKSVGNIVYPEDLLQKGYSGQEIRFYLLYGQRLKRINLTEANLDSSVRRLRAFRELVKDLVTRDFRATEPGASRGDLVQKAHRDAVVGFEAGMDDDLNVKKAFDSLGRSLSRMAKLKKEGSFLKSDSHKLEKSLRRIDEVLGFIF